MITTIHSSTVTRLMRSLRKPIRETQPVYWRKLIEAGIPIEEANCVAWAIARYEAAHKIPTSLERALIHKYCRLICRAELWCSKLLLDGAVGN